VQINEDGWTEDSEDSRLSQRHTADHPYIQALNKAQSLWTAKHYEAYDELTIGDLERREGSLQPLSLDGIPVEKIEKMSVKRDVSKSDLPESWDWRNVSGVNYVSPVRHQGGCGSCYAFSSAGMLEVRIRIATNNTQQPILSPQHVVSCSQYSQGCQGGFAYLIAGKYAYDFGMIEEDSFPYVANNTECTIKNEEEIKRWTVKDYYFVGGYYGATDAETIKREIVENGPVSISMLVHRDFKYYKSGVYAHEPIAFDSINPFRRVPTSHAVLAVGWGVTDEGVKYWIIKNSWGPTWGMDGYVHILREDGSYGGESSIESCAVSAIPNI